MTLSARARHIKAAPCGKHRYGNARPHRQQPGLDRRLTLGRAPRRSLKFRCRSGRPRRGKMRQTTLTGVLAGTPPGPVRPYRRSRGRKLRAPGGAALTPTPESASSTGTAHRSSTTRSVIVEVTSATESSSAETQRVRPTPRAEPSPNSGHRRTSAALQGAVAPVTAPLGGPPRAASC